MANDLVKVKRLEGELKRLQREIEILKETHKKRLIEAQETNKVFLEAFKRELDKIKATWWYKCFSKW